MDSISQVTCPDEAAIKSAHPHPGPWNSKNRTRGAKTAAVATLINRLLRGFSGAFAPGSARPLAVLSFTRGALSAEGAPHKRQEAAEEPKHRLATPESRF